MRIPIYVCNETDIALKTNQSTQAVALYEVLNDVNSQKNHSQLRPYFGVRIVKNTSSTQTLLYQNLFKRHKNCMFITTGKRPVYINALGLPFYTISRLFLGLLCIYLVAMGGFYTHHTRDITHTHHWSTRTVDSLANARQLHTENIFTQPLSVFISFFLNSNLNIRKLKLTHTHLDLQGSFSLEGVQTVATALKQLTEKIRFSENGRVQNTTKQTALWRINTPYEHQ